MNYGLPAPARWVPGKKSGTNVLLDPYGNRMLLKVTDSKHKFFWCSKTKKLLCPVRLTLDIDTDTIVRMSGEHNHDSKLVEESVKAKVATAIDIAVNNPTLNPRTVFIDVTNNVLEDPTTSSGLPHLPNPRSLARVIQRKRKAKVATPALPRVWDDMIVPEEFLTTIDGEVFLILDDNIPGKTIKVWGWASNYGIGILKSATDYYGDGTFEICKSTMFVQAWVLVAKSTTTNVCLPCAFFLLPDKLYATYHYVLLKLKDLGVTAPDIFHLDFEAAAIKAVKAVYPEAKVECCDTHWKRCLRSNQSEHGLITHMNEDSTIQQFNRKLWALSYIPEEDVIDVYTNIILPTLPVVDNDDSDNDEQEADDYTIAMDAYLNYFESTWIGAVNKRTGIRGRPKFNMGLWVKYAAVKEGRDDLTSNHSEAWNSASKLSIPKKANICVICKSIKSEEAFARAKFHRAFSRNPPSDPNPKRTKARLANFASLKRIVDLYKTVPHGAYIDAIAAHFNDA